MESKLRKGDENGEKIIHSFLEKHFYSKTQEYIPCNDKVNQVKGVDSQFVLNDKKYICDEKAAVQYVNKSLFTFSMELSFINRAGNENSGWLLDSNKINNSYLCVWIDKAINNVLSSQDDIIECEYALVDRNEIIKYLTSKGWTLDKLSRKSKEIRTSPDTYMGNIRKYGMKFSFSQRLIEQPINVLIPREELVRMADFTEKYKR